MLQIWKGLKMTCSIVVVVLIYQKELIASFRLPKIQFVVIQQKQMIPFVQQQARKFTNIIKPKVPTHPVPKETPCNNTKICGTLLFFADSENVKEF